MTSMQNREQRPSLFSMARTENGHKKLQPSLKVWLDDPAFGPLQHIETLYKISHDGVRFTYAKEWLKNPIAFQLDPTLTLDSGDFYPVNSNFGVFIDSCPDRWGQVLMQRHETIEAKEAGRTKEKLLHDMAATCAIAVPPSRIVRVGPSCISHMTLPHLDALVYDLPLAYSHDFSNMVHEMPTNLGTLSYAPFQTGYLITQIHQSR